MGDHMKLFYGGGGDGTHFHGCPQAPSCRFWCHLSGTHSSAPVSHTQQHTQLFYLKVPNCEWVIIMLMHYMHSCGRKEKKKREWGVHGSSLVSVHASQNWLKQKNREKNLRLDQPWVTCLFKLTVTVQGFRLLILTPIFCLRIFSWRCRGLSQGPSCAC